MWRQPMKVLIPLDVTDFPSEVLAAVYQLIGDHDQSHVLSVLSSVEATSVIHWGTIDGESREAFALRGLRQRLLDTDFAGAVQHVRFGDPADQICALAEAERVGLIVLPCRNQRSRLSRMFNGSVAESVVRRAPCPVLVIPLDAPPSMGEMAGDSAPISTRGLQRGAW